MERRRQENGRYKRKKLGLTYLSRRAWGLKHGR